MAFSLVAGILLSDTRSELVTNPLKIFASNLLVAALFYLGVNKMHRIQDDLNAQFQKVFNLKDIVEYEVPPTETLLAF